MEDEEIIATREQAIKALEAKGYEIVNTLFTDEWYSIPFAFLLKVWKICLFVMQLISVRVGKMPEGAGLSMMQR